MLLNKGDTASTFEVSRYLQPGTWRDALGGGSQAVTRSLKADVPAHGVKVYLLEAAVNQKELQAELAKAVADQQARTTRLSR
ncbi:phytoene dehydrogenase-like protein [Stenotrophomonas sp. SORGH_AS 282]|nr:phytoene dehydrogenase-like protein [Stenotrophomonas sp. SORGH_AS_0282]